MSKWLDYFMTWSDFQLPVLHGPYKGKELDRKIKEWIEESGEDKRKGTPRVARLLLTKELAECWSVTDKEDPEMDWIEPSMRGMDP